MTDTTVKALELPELTFEEAPHIYRLNGAQIPSVSRLMEPLKATNYAGVSDKTLAKAAAKGTSVHNSIENWLKFGIEDVQPEHQGYFDAFMAWYEDYHPVMVASEMRVYHKLLEYGATIDGLFLLGDDLTLVDFKTTYSLLEMSCGVQLEAYSQALASHGLHIRRKHILHMKKDGKYAFPEFPAKDPVRWRVVGSLKCLYDYEQSYNKKS